MVVAALKHPNGAKWSDGKIGEHVGVSQRMVTKYRQELTPTQKDSESPTREGRDGRTTNTANIGETDETTIKRLAAKGLSVREIAESVGWSKSRVARFLRTTESASGTKTGSRGTDDEQDEPETPTPARTADDSKSFGVAQSAKTLRSWSGANGMIVAGLRLSITCRQQVSLTPALGVF